MRLSFPGSHAYPGGRVAVTDDGGEDVAIVEFADGVTVPARLSRAGDALLVEVPAYRTARGTGIDARRWRVARGADGTWRAARVSRG